MFPMDGERLLASTASEAAIGRRHVVQLGPGGAHRASMQDRRHSWPVVRAWPGGSCKAIHGVEFSVGNLCHVVRLERYIFAAWGHLAGNGMLRFPAITAGLRRGSGPIRAPDSSDDTSLRDGPRLTPRGL